MFIFNVTRAVLETLPSHVHLVALLSQRAAVKSRHTQQRFVLWLRRLHELANPWKRFKSLVIFESMFREVLSQPFPCCVAWCFASARPCFVSRLCEAVVPRLCERRSLVQIPREALLHKSRSVVKFCDIFQSIAFSLHAWSLFVFPLSVVEVFVHTSHMMSHRTWFRALDLSLLLRVSLILRIKTCLIVSDVSDIQRASHGFSRFR